MSALRRRKLGSGGSSVAVIFIVARLAHAQENLSTEDGVAEPQSEPTAPIATAPAPEVAPPPPADIVESDAGSATLLAKAEEAVTNVDYERAAELSDRAISVGGLGSEDLVRAYRVLSVAQAQLGQTEAAERAFLRLFALDPSSNVAMRLSPTRRTAILNARGFWAVHKDRFGIDVSYARRDREIAVRVRDPLDWARTVHVWARFGDRPYAKYSRPVGRELIFEIPDAGPGDVLEVHAFVVDEHQNVLMQLGRPRNPHVFAPSDEELAALLRRDIRGGQTGSYARRLEELGVQVGVHGYVSLELKPVNDVVSFDLHHATAMIRANLLSAVSVELALEWEHLARQADHFYLPHAFLDMKASEWLVFRAGFFEAPVGAFNEYLYPDFLRITGLPPLFSQSVVPALWSEVGVQVRGRIPLAPSGALTYAAFVSNGLEQRDAEPTDGMLAEGGDIRAMRFNARDAFSADKAVGGRLGLEIEDLDFGVSAYTGRYTIEAERRLNIFDVDASFRSKWITIRTEAALARQETSAEPLHKYGGYALIATRPIPYLEPYLQYDFLRLTGRLHRGLAGVAFYPFPGKRATRSLRLKSEAGYDLPVGGDRNFVWFFQVTTGF